jgi:hypothetical protein
MGKSERYTFWQTVILSFAPGLPMVAVVFSVLVFGFTNIKAEINTRLDGVK